MTSSNKYEDNLEKNLANYTELTPLSFLERTARVFPDHTAVIHGSIRRNWLETYKRCIKFASALDKLGIKTGDQIIINFT